MTRLFLALTAIATLAACSSSSTSPSQTPTGGVTTLQIVDTRVGTGTEATNGRTLTVHYTGWLYNQNAPGNKGTQFDSSVGAQPFQLVLGAGRVIRGWDQGLVGMRVGGLRTLTIPPSLAYGSAGSAPSIPPNASLVFDVELLNVQ
jgi:FKBP-type peptidyl-prolyl cis-trans isomerase FkpA